MDIRVRHPQGIMVMAGYPEKKKNIRPNEK
jgi:hypothetical protein